ncbi:MAG: ABC transporter ATP-binding protein, partial [Pseudomonadota bacterium]
ELSGGQKQRVALARALVIRPDVLLLDEPLGALDRLLRDQMQVELKRIQRELGITTIIVTHDQEEALSLSDRVAVMFDGRIVETGAPDALYRNPESRQVMEFLGTSNIFRGRITAADGSDIAADCGGFAVTTRAAGRVKGERVQLGVRPEHIRIVTAKPKVRENVIAATVEETVYKGTHTEVYVRTDGDQEVMARSQQAGRAEGGGFRKGARIFLTFDGPDVLVF